MTIPPLIFSWTPGMGGDMVKTSLLALMVSGNWEFKPCHAEFYKDNPLANCFPTSFGLYCNSRLISFIDWRGQVQKVEPLGTIESSHYAETQHEFVDSLIKEHGSLITFLSPRNIKYLKIAQKNWLIKTSVTSGDRDSIAWWDNEYEKAILKRNDSWCKYTNIFLMDSIYNWESYEAELKKYLARYEIYPETNMHLVKEFWSKWMEEQSIK